MATITRETRDDARRALRGSAAHRRVGRRGARGLPAYLRRLGLDGPLGFLDLDAHALRFLRGLAHLVDEPLHLRLERRVVDRDLGVRRRLVRLGLWRGRQCAVLSDTAGGPQSVERASAARRRSRRQTKEERRSAVARALSCATRRDVVASSSRASSCSVSFSFTCVHVMSTWFFFVLFCSFCVVL